MKKITANLACAVAGLYLLLSCAHPGETRHEAHWGYEGHGDPSHWADLNPDYKACATGQKQSPIDLNGQAAKPAVHAPIVFQYAPSAIHVVNNGHTVQFNYDAGSKAVIDGQPYQLIQFHFHAPSEHTMNGRSYPLEVHLVHKSASGNLAVIGVLFEKGQMNGALATLWKSFPKEVGQADAAGTFDARMLLPAGTKFFTYPGSLTTPPCSEGVLWNVAQTPGTATPEQVDFFEHNFYRGNARPVQPLNNRPLDLY